MYNTKYTNIEFYRIKVAFVRSDVISLLREENKNSAQQN